MKTYAQLQVSFVALLAATAIAVLTACPSRSDKPAETQRRAGSAQQPREISVRFPIPIVESGQASFYLAEDRGYYEREGLKVRWQMGSKELNPIKTVVAGSDQFGVMGGPDSVIVARSKGHPVVAVGVIHRNSNFPCLLTLKSSGITAVEQLDKRKVGFFYGHISTDVLRALFQKTGTAPVEVDVGFSYSQFIAGQLDAQWAFTVTAGLDLPAKGVEVNVISPGDYGIVTHGYTIFTTDIIAKTDPELVTRFLRASFAGIRDAVASPEAATDALLRRDSTLDRELTVKRQRAYNAATSASEAYPPGYMDRAMFSETYERLLGLGVIEQTLEVGEAFTTHFLEKAH